MCEKVYRMGDLLLSIKQWITEFSTHYLVDLMILDSKHNRYASTSIDPIELYSILEEIIYGKIDEILESNKPTTVRLKKYIPVHILYFTVYEEDGLAYFKNDIYSYDKIIEESVPYNRKSTFTLPKRKMIAVDKNAKSLSN